MTDQSRVTGKFLLLATALLAVASLACRSDWDEIAAGIGARLGPGKRPPVAPDGGPSPDSGSPAPCHDLAPDPRPSECRHHPDVCPLTAPPLGGHLEDGVYSRIVCQACKTNEDVVTASIPVRLRVSAQGTRLDWTADAPVFSAIIETRGTELLVTETCRWRPGGSVQPPYPMAFTAAGDELTLYNGLWVQVFRKESHQ